MPCLLLLPLLWSQSFRPRSNPLRFLCLPLAHISPELDLRSPPRCGCSGAIQGAVVIGLACLGSPRPRKTKEEEMENGKYFTSGRMKEATPHPVFLGNALGSMAALNGGSTAVDTSVEGQMDAHLPAFVLKAWIRRLIQPLLPLSCYHSMVSLRALCPSKDNDAPDSFPSKTRTFESASAVVFAPGLVRMGGRGCEQRKRKTWQQLPRL